MQVGRLKSGRVERDNLIFHRLIVATGCSWATRNVGFPRDLAPQGLLDRLLTCENI